MGSSRAPFSDIGKRAKDLLTKDYSFDHMLNLSMSRVTRMLASRCFNVGEFFNSATTYERLYSKILISSGLTNDSEKGLTAIGLRNDKIFFNNLYKRGNTIIDVKVDTYSNISTKVTVNDVLPSTKAAISFKLSNYKSGKDKLDMPYLHDDYAIYDSISLDPTLDMPYHDYAIDDSINLHPTPISAVSHPDMPYLHHDCAIYDSISLNPTPILELSAATESKELTLGGEVGFDVASGSFTKFSAGIGLNKLDSSAARLLTGKGQTLKASYVHSVSPVHSVAAELSLSLSAHENSFTIGSSHALDPLTVVKTRFSDGKLAMLWQREWRPKSLVTTVSAEYDSGAIHTSALKCGLSLVLKL